MTQINVKVGHELEAFLESIADKMPGEMRRRVLLAAQHAVGEIRGVLSERLYKRGGLARSFKATFLGSEEAGVVSAGAVSDLVYARIQDEGGLIRPKTGRMLAIPHPLANIPPGKWPRHFPRGKLFRIGKLLVEPIMRGPRRGTQGPGEMIGLKPKFILVDKVNIKPKRYIEEASRRSRDGIEDILVNGVERVVKDAD